MLTKKLLTSLLSIFSSSATVNTVEPEEQKYRLYFSITDIDTGSVKLRENIHTEGMIFNKLNHDDGSEYYFATLKKPLQSEGRQIIYIIIGARDLREHIGPKMKNFPINIAYVIDDSLIDQKNMDFNKGEFVAVGFATDTSNETIRFSN